MRRSNKPPTFIIAGKLIKKVSNITYKLLCFLNILNILAILRVRITVVEDAELRSKKKEAINTPSDAKITTKSKIFHPSLKNLSPKPIIFVIISSIKINRKALLI